MLFCRRGERETRRRKVEGRGKGGGKREETVVVVDQKAAKDRWSE